MFTTQKVIRRSMAGIGLAAAIGVAAAGIIESSGGASSPANASTGTASVRSEVVSVSGHPESILVDGHGLPLYYYGGDSASVSHVSGGLARAWPPLTAASVQGPGLTGTLATVKDSHGLQVAYNGHLLYTFVSDRTGVVTGQGVQNFYVATPTITAQVAPPPRASNGY